MGTRAERKLRRLKKIAEYDDIICEAFAKTASSISTDDPNYTRKVFKRIEQIYLCLLKDNPQEAALIRTACNNVADRFCAKAKELAEFREKEKERR